jgi:hypothetical protein
LAVLIDAEAYAQAERFRAAAQVSVSKAGVNFSKCPALCQMTGDAMAGLDFRQCRFLGSAPRLRQRTAQMGSATTRLWEMDRYDSPSCARSETGGTDPRNLPKPDILRPNQTTESRPAAA